MKLLVQIVAALLLVSGATAQDLPSSSLTRGTGKSRRDADTDSSRFDCAIRVLQHGRARLLRANLLRKSACVLLFQQFIHAW
jgi:hypothetical protein